MSKKLIAGAGVVASFAIALAPLATFAEASDTHTDELVINVPAACTFGDSTQSTVLGGITHGESDKATWVKEKTTAAPTGFTDKDDEVESTGAGTVTADLRGNETAVNASKHTAYYTIKAGTVEAGFASTTMKVVCTNTTGYRVQVATEDLKNETSGYTDEKIFALAGTSTAAAYSASASGYDLDSIVANNGAEGASDVASGKDKFYANTAAGTAETIVTHTGVSAPAGDTITVTYGIGVQGNQAAGTYSGKVVYSLFQGIED